MATGANGTRGYAENAESLVRAWRELSFAEIHRPILHLLPTIPSNVLDIGAGIGTDAAALAAMGHNVVAVEPVDEFRAAGMELHQSQKIEWLDDSLPELAIVRSTKVTFDLVMLTAVWMHLDEDERRRAMPNVCSLLGDGGLLIMSLRHGPIPPGRRMFDVSAEETIGLVRGQGLLPVLEARTESAQQANRDNGVSWTWIALVKESAFRDGERNDRDRFCSSRVGGGSTEHIPCQAIEALSVDELACRWNDSEIR
jgi:SAM-dependent methyltransferase